MNDATVDVFDGWEVREEHGFWVAYHDDQGYLHDLTDARYPARYDTRPALLEHLLGPAYLPV